jgi:hypothetical protein
MALLVYTNQINNRIQYVFEFIFEHILGVEFAFCSNKENFIDHVGPKIEYGMQQNFEGLFFGIHRFMLAHEIIKQDLAFANFNHDKVPFRVADAVFPFDVFAAAFYFLSRYEEYIIPERDEHHRFEGKSSLAFQLGIINRPMIDEWALAVADEITKQFPDFKIADRDFNFIPTLDIDRPYYLKTEPFYKKALKQLRQISKTDPFDVYEQVHNWDLQFKLNTIFFFLVGNKHDNDPAPDLDNQLFINIIQEISTNHQIGIHPSYFSYLNASEIEAEKKALEKISGKQIEISRQHYLLLSLPQTYRDLIATGIKEDFTLAFADLAGFRASTCTPFFWYDLENDEVTDLYVRPTAVMDQTLRKYMALSAVDATKLIEELIQNVKSVHGTFISLWHNESINDFGVWKGWKEVYINMLEKGAIVK